MCWWCADNALMIHCWCAGGALMMHWWCAVDTLMMHWWCADDALMMHWWSADDALTMRWWCANDALLMRCWCAVDALLMRYWWAIDVILMRWWCSADGLDLRTMLNNVLNNVEHCVEVADPMFPTPPRIWSAPPPPLPWHHNLQARLQNWFGKITGSKTARSSNKVTCVLHQKFYYLPKYDSHPICPTVCLFSKDFEQRWCIWKDSRPVYDAEHILIGRVRCRGEEGAAGNQIDFMAQKDKR